ncbi:hypothetical protein CR513_17010, partial [Mucuna pruriens]
MTVESPETNVKSEWFLSVNREYQARDPQLMKHLDKATKMATAFEKFTLHHVPREQNERANLLSKLATS